MRHTRSEDTVTKTKESDVQSRTEDSLNRIIRNIIFFKAYLLYVQEIKDKVEIFSRYLKTPKRKYGNVIWIPQGDYKEYNGETKDGEIFKLNIYTKT